jgi:hypothetical protein
MGDRKIKTSAGSYLGRHRGVLLLSVINISVFQFFCHFFSLVASRSNASIRIHYCVDYEQ